ncbi:hypothetical protein DL768_005538 [Monosporascus sp. mg162]|nr:hypothetical protein DL768_005538 [Monosporascus sp. mg162]
MGVLQYHFIVTKLCGLGAPGWKGFSEVADNEPHNSLRGNHGMRRTNWKRNQRIIVIVTYGVNWLRQNFHKEVAKPPKLLQHMAPL